MMIFFVVIGAFIAMLLLFGIPILFYKYGPKIGEGGAEVLGVMWLIFGCFPCAGAGAAIAMELKEFFK